MWFLDWVLFNLCQFIYPLIPNLYEGIEKLAKVDLFSGSGAEIRNNVWNNLYILLSVVILFAIAIKLINAIVNPDVLGEKKKGVKSLYFRAFISVFLVIMLPIAFDILKDVQDHILDNNIISKIIIGTTAEDGGQTLAKYTANAFVDFPDDSNNPLLTDKNIDVALEEMDTAEVHRYRENGYVNKINTLLMLIAGIFIVYELIIIALDTAVRAIKLKVLELMVPIVLGGYMFKEEILKKWVIEYIKTFVQLFLLLVSIYLIAIVLPLVREIVNEDAQYGWVIKTLLIFGLLTLARQIPNLINTIFGVNIKGKGGISGRLGEMATVGGLAKNAWGALGTGAKGVGKGALNTGKAITKAPGAAIKYHGQNFLDKKFGTKPGAIRAKAWGQGISAAVKSGDPSKFYATRDEKLKSPSYLSSISAKTAKGISASGVNEHGVYNNLDANGGFKTNVDHREDANTILNEAGKSFVGAKGRKLVDSMESRFKADQKTNLLNGIKSSRDKVVAQLNDLHSSMASSGLYDEKTLSKIDTIAKKFEADGKISAADADVLSNYLSEGGANLLASTYGKMTRGIIDAKKTFEELKNENLNGAVSLGNNISIASKESDGYKADEESMLENMTAAEKAQYKVYSAGLSEISATTAGASQNDKNIDLTGEDSWAFLDADHIDANDYVVKTRAKAAEKQTNSQNTSGQSGSNLSDSFGGSDDRLTPPETLYVDGSNQQDYFAAQNEARLEYLISKEQNGGLTASEAAEKASLSSGATGDRLKARKAQQQAPQDMLDNEGTLDE